MTKTSQQTDLKSFIEKETRALAGEFFEEIWDEIEEANLETDVVAEVFIQRTLAKLAASKGDTSASRMVSHFSKLDEMGGLGRPPILQ
jgi:hypothetical protein